MTREDELAIYKKTLAVWGLSLQLDMLIEECSELITAISKWRRTRSKITEDAVMEEMVDVHLMIEQIRYYINDESKWEQIKSAKLRRVRSLLGGKLQ